MAIQLAIHGYFPVFAMRIASFWLVCHRIRLRFLFCRLYPKTFFCVISLNLISYCCGFPFFFFVGENFWLAVFSASPFKVYVAVNHIIAWQGLVANVAFS
jgi:hypothetical protein